MSLIFLILISIFNIFKGDYVWIAPLTRSEFAIPTGAKILDIKNNVYFVEDDDGKVLFSVVVF